MSASNRAISRFRPINLILVAWTQLFFALLVLNPFLESHELPVLDTFALTIIVITTIIISAGGYIINDIFDIEIDQINKPQRALKNPQLWTSVYKLLFVLGFLSMSIYSWKVTHPYYLAVYVLAWLALRRYSSHWKCTPLWGNLVVSIFSASVVIVLLIPCWNALRSLEPTQLDRLIRPFSYYFIFAFWTSLIREVVKDLQDEDGDRKNNCNTLAVSIGVPRAKWLVQMMIVLFLCFLGIWQYQFIGDYPFTALVYLNVLVTIPYIYLLIQVDRASKATAFGWISTRIKWTMMTGILFLIFEWWIL